ncbi:MAG: hypothetical protein M1826_006065 [Phylliscum demangeonii]|nr:MAG: hypothetical protein M1826_006065 [Phylliscum demangeonii]
MHKITNLTGSARHGWERMTPTFGLSRPSANPNPDAAYLPSAKRPLSSSPHSPTAMADAILHLSFNVPFSSNLAGPDGDDILHASPGALERWLHPEGTPEGTPIHKLPVHVANLEALRQLCREVGENAEGKSLEAAVTSSEPKGITALQRRPSKGLVTNVCLSGDAETVHRMRAKILHETPLAMRCATVEVDNKMVIDTAADAVKSSVLDHLDLVASFTGTDIFLLGPKLSETESSIGTTFNGSPEISLDQRLQVVIYGDMESVEHAKTRVLIMIDQVVGARRAGEAGVLEGANAHAAPLQLRRTVDAITLEAPLHPLICGRSRRNIKLIESTTNTAIYFPPSFPRIYGYTPPGAHRRGEDEVFITGPDRQNIVQAKHKLSELVRVTKCYVKDVVVTASKIDAMLVDRLDKIRKISEINGSFILFPQIGTQRSVIRVQATEMLYVERTIREIMTLAGQFYSASWWILLPDPVSANGMRAPSPSDIRTMLSDICTNSGADVSFDKLTFSINGSDDAVKAAMMVIYQIPFVKRAQYQMRVKIELANEHKEFVSGKKNGKINKIMGQSNVQIIFDGFNEYDFYIDVCGGQYEAVKNGLDLVEQEMPASISFHVPDQYHKRIIGIGGQHIQRIMKKYSVFVKFSNAMDRGGVGKEDDDVKVENVICRTPARNAQNLDLVKQEIMDMVEKVDAEFVQERVVINRLYHRKLMARMGEIEGLERKWNCKVIFPSTEMASDVVIISGPEYQVPQAVDDFLGMVPESHEIILPSAPELRDFLLSDQFKGEVQEKLKAQYEVDLYVNRAGKGADKSGQPTESLLLTYTRNNAGGLQDAIDFLISRLVAHGLDATTIRGSIPRPKSDSFEDSLPFFDSKLLQHAPAPVVTESASATPTAAADDDSERSISIFDRLRKPGSLSSISSFLERRKNHPNSSPGSVFRHGSSNNSKASLVSIESQPSAYRQVWNGRNDSGVSVNLPDDGDHPAAAWPYRHPPDLHHKVSASVGSLNVHVNGNGNGSGNGHGHGHGSAMTGFGAAGAGAGAGGDATPKMMDARASFDSGRPSTSHSASGYPGLIGAPR